MGYYGEEISISLDKDFYKSKPRIFMEIMSDLYDRKKFNDEVITAIEHWTSNKEVSKEDGKHLQDMALSYIEENIIEDRITYYNSSMYYDWGNRVSQDAQQKLAKWAAQRAVSESNCAWQPGGEYFPTRRTNAYQRHEAIKLAESGKINPLDLLKHSLDADFGFIKAVANTCSNVGLAHPDVKAVIATSKKHKFCIMEEKDFKKTATRRALMRRLCDDEKLGKKLSCKVTFTLGDLRSLTSDQKFKFIQHYFGPSHFQVEHRPATYGKNVRLETFTSEDMDLSLFPLLTTKFEEISAFMERYKKYFAKKEDKNGKSTGVAAKGA